MNSTQETRRFETALQTRQFEIDLFWKRSLFFWGFISAAFLTIGALKEQLPMVSLLVSGFGLICSISWTLVNRGSKYWQEQWESKIEKVENEVTGPLFKTRESEQGKGWWGGRKYSVSKVTTAVSDYVGFVWFCIFVRQVWICFRFFQSDRYRLVFTVALCVIPLVYMALLLGFGRTTPSQCSTDSEPMSGNASNDQEVGVPIPKLDPASRPWWGRIVARKHTLAVLGYTAAFALVGSVLFGWFTRHHPTLVGDKTLTKVGIAKVLVLAAWILLPPIWFWLEYFGIYRYEGGTFDDLDQFKYGQDVSAKIWLAAVTALGILYFGKDFKV